MKTGAQVGLAVAAGYVLGRYHKGRWALALAAMGAGKKLPGPQGAILEQGRKLLSSTPVVGNLTEEVRGQLVEAGRTAVMSAASKRIDSFSDALRDRSDQMRGTGKQADDEEPEDEREGAEGQGEEEPGSPPARRAPRARKASESGAARKPRGTSTSRAKSPEGSPARPRTRTGSSGQESRPRRRTPAGEGAKQESAATTRRRSQTRSTGQR